MEKLTVEPIQLEQLESNNNPLQSGLWANVKKGNGWIAYPFAITIGAKRSTLLVLVKKLLLNYSIAYLPYGPEEGFYHPELSEKLTPLLPKGVVFIRYDLPFGNTQKPTNIKVLKESIQPEGSVILDLTKGYVEVSKSYRQRAIRHIKRGKERGLEIFKWEGDEATFEGWYRLYRQKGVEKEFSPRTSGYIKQFFTYSGEKCRAELYCAAYQDKLVGGIVLLKGVSSALYLFGTSKNIDKVSPAYLLQDYAIRELCNRNFKSYDLHGISGEGGRGSHLAGLDQFKLSFGGEKVVRHPSFDTPLKPLLYYFYSILERWRMRRYRGSNRDS